MTVTIPGFGEVLAWKAVAPPFAVALFTIYYKYFLAGPVWMTRIGIFLEEAQWIKSYNKILSYTLKIIYKLFGNKSITWHSFSICIIISFLYSTLWFWIISNTNEFLNGKFIFALFVGSIFIFSSFITMFTIINSNLYYRSLIYKLFIKPSIILGIIVMSCGLTGLVFDFHKEKSSIYLIKTENLLYNEFYLYYLSIYLSKFFGGALLSIVPIINAISDFISIEVTRWAIKNLIHDTMSNNFFNRWVKISIHISIDILFAVISLLIINILLLFLFSSQFSEENFAWIAARDAPWSLEGSKVTIMLLSTLVPTALHLFCAVFAILPALPFGHKWAASFIPAKYEDFEPGDKAVVAGFLTVWTLVSLAALYGIFWAGLWVADLITLQFEWPDGAHRDLWRSIFHIAEGVAGFIRG